jgi:hypothetical protein
LAEATRQCGNRRVFKHLGDGQLGAELLLYQQMDAHQQKRITAEVEEVVVHTHGLETEKLLPDFGQPLLDIALWYGAARGFGLRCGPGWRARRNHSRRCGRSCRRHRAIDPMPLPLERMAGKNDAPPLHATVDRRPIDRDSAHPELAESA